MTAPDDRERKGPQRRPRGRPYKNVPDPGSAGMLGVGMIIGAVVGAGVALLLAPQAGWETRQNISRRARRLSHGDGAWTKLGKELRKAAKAKRQSLEAEARRNEIETKRAAAGQPAI